MSTLSRPVVVMLVVAAVACSSASAPPPSPLEGTYRAASAGEYSELVFGGDSQYSLTRNLCGGSVPCSETGTFTLSADRTELTLTDSATKHTTTLPFEAIETVGGDAGPAVSTDSLHLSGGTLTSGVTALTSLGHQLVNAFYFGKQYLTLVTKTGVPLTTQGPTPSGHAAKYPFIMEHGWASSNAHNTFPATVISALENDGNTIKLADVSPFGTVEVRAGQLLMQINDLIAQTGATKVNIVAHSMGGLDARYLASPAGLNRGDLVASITTISTPHRGSRFADIAVGLLTGSKEPTWLANVVDSVLGDVGDAYAGVEGSSHANNTELIASLKAISVATSPEFNAKYVDDPNVDYYSWTGLSSIDGTISDAARQLCATGANPQGDLLANGVTFITEAPLLLSARYTGSNDIGKTDPNDSMVAIESGVWGQYQGCFPGDHMTELGQTFTGVINGVVPSTGWDPVRFYRNWVYSLAANGH